MNMEEEEQEENNDEFVHSFATTNSFEVNNTSWADILEQTSESRSFTEEFHKITIFPTTNVPWEGVLNRHRRNVDHQNKENDEISNHPSEEDEDKL